MATSALIPVAAGEFSLGASRDDSRASEPNPMCWPAILLSAGLHLTYLFYLTVLLDFSMFRSDVALYWTESQHLHAPYSTWWVPGYPALIALVRTATFDTLPPITVMVLISGAFYIVAVHTVATIARTVGLRHPLRVAGLFAVFPFVGLTYNVWPIADATAIAFFLLALLSFERQRWVMFAVYAAAAVMIHKSMWFFMPCLVLVAMARHPNSRRVVPLTFLPLVLWVVGGAVYHHDPLWFARWGVEHLVKSRSTLPVLDGLIGPLLTGGITKFAKMAVILSVLVAAGAVLRRGYATEWRSSGVAVAVAVMVLAVSMNQTHIWAVARFGKTLVIPFAVAVAHTRMWNLVLERPWIYGSIVLASAVSNAAYGYYIAKYFFA